MGPSFRCLSTHACMFVRVLTQEPPSYRPCIHPRIIPYNILDAISVHGFLMNIHKAIKYDQLMANVLL